MITAEQLEKMKLISCKHGDWTYSHANEMFYKFFDNNMPRIALHFDFLIGHQVTANSEFHKADAHRPECESVRVKSIHSYPNTGDKVFTQMHIVNPKHTTLNSFWPTQTMNTQFVTMFLYDHEFDDVKFWFQGVERALSFSEKCDLELVIDFIKECHETFMETV